MAESYVKGSSLIGLDDRSSPGPARAVLPGTRNFVPDAISASVILLAVVVAAALAIGNPATTVVDAYYRGLWMLLPFTMQMTLILVLSAVVSSTPLFRRAVVALADRPTTVGQVVALAVGLGAALAYLYWGLGVALAPIIAIHFSAAAERKGIPVDFPFLLAAVSAATGIWQFGLSSSPALLMATPGHFLDATVGVLSLRSTIWSLPAVADGPDLPGGRRADDDRPDAQGRAAIVGLPRGAGGCDHMRTGCRGLTVRHGAGRVCGVGRAQLARAGDPRRLPGPLAVLTTSSRRATAST